MKTKTYNSGEKDFLIQIDDDFIILENQKLFFTVLCVEESYIIVKIAEKPYKIYINNNESVFDIYIEGVYFRLRLKNKITEYLEKIESAGKRAGREHHIVSPMPGLVTKILKKAGDSVGAGETVLFLEAMKMENAIKSLYVGVLEEIYVEENKNIEKGTPLFSVK